MFPVYLLAEYCLIVMLYPPHTRGNTFQYNAVQHSLLTAASKMTTDLNKLSDSVSAIQLHYIKQGDVAVEDRNTATITATNTQLLFLLFYLTFLSRSLSSSQFIHFTLHRKLIFK